MKAPFYLISLFMLFVAFSCESDDTTILITQDTLVGNWKLTEYSYSTGGPEIWETASSGSEIEFFNNGTFAASFHEGCASGSFSLNSEMNELTLEYNCDDFSSIAQNDDGLIVFYIEFGSDNQFLLAPKSGPICTEGCRNKFTKQQP